MLFALRLQRALREEPDLPGVRTGFHMGEVNEGPAPMVRSTRAETGMLRLQYEEGSEEGYLENLVGRHFLDWLKRVLSRSSADTKLPCREIFLGRKNFSGGVRVQMNLDHGRS